MKLVPFLFNILLYGTLGITIASYSGKAFGQADPYPAWETFTAGNFVRKMAQNGNCIWAATRGGLVKINKKTGEITYYNTGNSLLPDNNIEALAIDSSGKKWIGAAKEHDRGSGLVVMEDQNMNIYNESNSNIPDNDITAIAIDHNNNKWLGTAEGNLVKFTGSRWVHFDITDSEISNSEVLALAVDKENKVWVSSRYEGGVKVYDGNSWEHYHKRYTVRSIFIDEQNNKWIAIPALGLVKRNNQQEVKIIQATDDFHPNGFTWSVVVDDNGTKWLGTTNLGIMKIKGQNWSLITKQNSGLTSNYVTSLFIDKQGNKWIGTSADGIMKFDGKSWFSYPTSQNNLSSNFINSIDIEQNGTKWFGTDGAGLSKLKGGEWTSYASFNSSFPYAFGLDMISVVKGERAKLWMSNRLSVVLMQSYPFGPPFWKQFKDNNSKLTATRVWDLAKGDKGNIWACGKTGGLKDFIAKYDGNHWRQSNFTEIGLPDITPYNLTIDEQGVKWIGTRTGGLVKFSEEEQRVFNEANSPLPSNAVWTVELANGDGVWLGTSKGLVKFNNGTWKVYDTTNSDLPDNRVVSMHVGKWGNKWIGTDNGLARLNKKQWKVYKKRNSGLGSNRIEAIEKDNNGNLWIGTYYGGLSRLDRNLVSTKRSPVSEKNLTVFPNPTVGSVQVKLSRNLETARIRVISQTGRILSSHRMKGTQKSIQLPEKSGIYFVKVMSNDFSKSEKVLKLNKNKK
jgi:ligand-binding sensor domain-containing protein